MKISVYRLCLAILVSQLFINNPWASAQTSKANITGDLQKWHRVTLTFDGPQSGEQEKKNPFRNYRLLVTFKRGKQQYLVPGFFAADGNAAESGASKGNKWRVHFTPDATGEWIYEVSFRMGKDIGVSLDPDAGKATSFDGAKGSFTIKPSDKKGRDHRAKGRLNYVGEHYLRFAETNDYFLKGGADSPENFLGYKEFDDTPKARHKYQPHVRDWRKGDPTWKGGKGKGIIGALNYLSSQGMNSVYFLTMNVRGDGRDVWPWTSEKERFRFDCSKLDQWEIVFSHMDAEGILLHVITQEQENDQLLDGGDLGLERKYYYRELIARFSHHLAIVWNLGEENTNTHKQRKQFCNYIRELDPYDHPIVVHTFPGRYDKIYNPLLGFKNFEGPSLQTNQTHEQTLRWVERSAKKGRKWVVCLDEIGPANTGVKPDKNDPGHDQVRKKHLWGNLMAGGAGCEWYFGYRYAHNDLNCEDFRSRANMWAQTRFALEFFHHHLPFWEMKAADEITSNDNDYCFAQAGSVYAIYLPNGGSTKLKAGKGKYSVHWYNPRKGGELQAGSVKTIQGPGLVSVGNPPAEAKQDWVALVRALKK